MELVFENKGPRLIQDTQQFKMVSLPQEFQVFVHFNIYLS